MTGTAETSVWVEFEARDPDNPTSGTRSSVRFRENPYHRSIELARKPTQAT